VGELNMVAVLLW